MSMWRHDVDTMLFWRHVPAGISLSVLMHGVSSFSDVMSYDSENSVGNEKKIEKYPCINLISRLSKNLNFVAKTKLGWHFNWIICCQMIQLKWLTLPFHSNNSYHMQHKWTCVYMKESYFQKSWILEICLNLQTNL